MKKEAIYSSDTELIKSHKLFSNGSALYPYRFWTYKLVNTSRPYDEKDLIGFYEIDLLSATIQYEGVSFSLLIN